MKRGGASALCDVIIINKHVRTNIEQGRQEGGEKNEAEEAYMRAYPDAAADDGVDAYMSWHSKLRQAWGPLTGPPTYLATLG